MSEAIEQLELRPGSPDFQDLPWHLPLADWEGATWRMVYVPRGLSRHEVRFVRYRRTVFAFKELPPGAAAREYALLMRLEQRRLPAVTAIGHARAKTAAGEPVSMLITRYLDDSLPYRILFRVDALARYRDRLLDAIAGLLVRLHLAGFYWGDCSLSNTLFRRDAGELKAYLVDAETSDFPKALTDAHRRQDLFVLQENVAGELADMAGNEGGWLAGIPLSQTGPEIRRRYERLWSEVTREEAFHAGESYRMHERLAKLNALGFSVGEIEIVVTGEKNRVRMRTMVTDRDYHRRQLESVTGVIAEDRQARAMLEEIHEIRAWLAAERGTAVTLEEAVGHWKAERWEPALARLEDRIAKGAAAPELYCQVLEHKWFLSEREQHDVGMERALEDYLLTVPETGAAVPGADVSGSSPSPSPGVAS